MAAKEESEKDGEDCDTAGNGDCAGMGESWKEGGERQRNNGAANGGKSVKNKLRILWC